MVIIFVPLSGYILFVQYLNIFVYDILAVFVLFMAFFEHF